MQHEKTLTVRFEGDQPTARHKYSLAEFPKAYAAIMRACRRAHP